MGSDFIKGFEFANFHQDVALFSVAVAKCIICMLKPN